MDYNLSASESAKILKEWKIADLELEEQIIKIFEKVRDIKFGHIGSRDPMEIYKAGKGTCSGKNFLARELYKAVGLETKDMICLQRWKDLSWFPDDEYGLVDFPEELLKKLEEEEIVDFHNYVLVKIDGNWVQVDVTIDKDLQELGFRTEIDWDGKSDMPLCFVGSHKVWDCGDNGAEKKAELTAQLPSSIQNARSDFLSLITEWIDEWREE